MTVSIDNDALILKRLVKALHTAHTALQKLGDTPDEIKATLTAMHGLTPQQIQAACRIYKELQASHPTPQTIELTGEAPT